MENFKSLKVKIFITCVITSFFIVSCASKSKDLTEKKSPKEISQLYVELGTAALLRGEYSQAVEDLRKALVAESNNAMAHNHLGLAYYALGQKELGKSEVQKAVKVDPNYSDAYVNLGNIAANEHQNKLARQYFNKALENLEYKLRHRALTNLAQLALSENNIDEARNFLYQSLQANPDFCLSHFLLGTIFIRDNNPKHAATELTKSVAANCVGNLQGHYQLGLAYIKLKEFAKARHEFVFLMEEFPQTIEAQHASEQLRDIP